MVFLVENRAAGETLNSLFVSFMCSVGLLCFEF